MRSSLSSLAAIAVLGIAVGCSSSATLVIDVRSDLVLGVEASAVMVRYEYDGDVVTRDLGLADDLLGGVRADERGGLPEGPQGIYVALLDPDGAVVLERTVRVQATGRTGVIVLLTRSCLSVSCPMDDPEATECEGGFCVPPECGTGECVISECAQNTDCPAPPASCATAVCVESSCLAAALPGSCGLGEVCVPDQGCLEIEMPMPDAMPMDSRPPDTSVVDSGTPDTSTPDTGTPDTGTPDTGPCPGECTPGMVATTACPGSNCETRSRTCRSDCTWGSYGSCSDDDDECPSTAPECIQDYCWGWELREQSSMSCIDMGRDYLPGAPEYGVLAHRVRGRPGATWTKENRAVSCGGSWYSAETDVIGSSGVFDWTFPYSASLCSNAVLGRWFERLRVRDTDGSTFFVGSTNEVTFYNNTCASNRSTCGAARTFCGAP